MTTPPKRLVLLHSCSLLKLTSKLETVKWPASSPFSLLTMSVYSCLVRFSGIVIKLSSTLIGDQWSGRIVLLGSEIFKFFCESIWFYYAQFFCSKLIQNVSEDLFIFETFCIICLERLYFYKLQFDCTLQVKEAIKDSFSTLINLNENK